MSLILLSVGITGVSEPSCSPLSAYRIFFGILPIYFSNFPSSVKYFNVLFGSLLYLLFISDNLHDEIQFFSTTIKVFLCQIPK